MKKLLVLCLVVLLCVSALVACNSTENAETDAPKATEAPKETEAPKATENQGTEPEDDEKEEPKVEYDLTAAAAYVDSLYKKAATVTASDYKVVGQVMIAGVKYSVSWSVDNELVKAVKSEDGVEWTIDVNEKAAEEHTYKLTATITAGDGTTTTVSYDRSVPKYELTPFEDYINAEADVNVVIEGVVVAMNSKSLGNSRNHLFLADLEGKGGYYCYQFDEDPVEKGVKVGMTVIVRSVTSPYSGMQETKGGSFEISDTTIKTVTPLDLTDKFAAGESLKNYVGLPVTVRGVTLGTQELETATSQYLFFELNGKEAYVRTYVTDFPTTLQIVKGDNNTVSSPDKTTIDEDHAAHFGYTADVTGILILYSGNPYLIPMTTTPFTNYTYVEKTPAQKVEAEKDALSVPKAITEDTTITLPLEAKYYDDVTITWAIDNDKYTIDADGKLVIALGDEAVELTLTATIKCGETTDTATFKIKVDAAATDLYIAKPVTTPAADTAYKFALVQGNLGKTLYLTGEISGDRYAVTTDKPAQAVDVYVETVTGGIKFYILDGETKKYITVYKNSANKDAIKFDAEGTSVFTYNSEVNAWVTKLGDTDYYLGTYSTYNTVSASKLSYITAENTGKDQFPAGFATLAPATYVNTAVTAPAADTAYKFALVQGNLGKTLYLTGEISGDRYVVTTDKPAQAVDVYVETVTGGIKFYILDGETKKYITVYKNSANKDAIKFDAEGTSVFTYNSEVNAWVTKLGDTDYYLGTYSTYNTVSASKLSYITAENTGKDQFPAGLFTLEIAD